LIGKAQVLNPVGEMARGAASVRQMSEYAFLVIAAPKGGHQVAVSKGSPESLFTQAVCDPIVR